MIKIIRNILAALVLIIFSACSDDGPTAPTTDPVPGYTIPATTKIVNTQALEQIEQADSDFTFRFSANSAFADSLKNNDVMVSGVSAEFPNGFLRKVTAVKRDRDQIVINTTQATLPEVITKGAISFEHQTLQFSNIRENRLNKGVKVVSGKNGRGLGFDIDFNEIIYEENSDYISSQGHLMVDLGFNFLLDWEVEPTSDAPYYKITLKKFKNSVDVEQSASIYIDSHMSHFMHRDVSLGSIIFNPWTFFVGPVPVVFVPKIEFALTAEGTISANLTSYVTESYHGEVGIEYKNSDWQEIFVNDAQFNYLLPNINSSANFTISAGPKASLMLYGIIGPFVGLKGYGKLEASAVSKNRGINAKLIGGIKGYAGAKVEVMGINVLNTDWDLFDIQEELWKLENGTIPPSVAFISPQANQQFDTGALINLQVNTTGNPDSVVYYADSKRIAKTTAPFISQVSASQLGSGTHTLEAKAYFNSEIKNATVSIKISDPVWTKIDVSHLLTRFDHINSVFFFDQQYGWCAGSNDVAGYGPFVLKTTDGGKTWKKIKMPSGVGVYEIKNIVFTSRKEGYAAGNEEFYYTSDGGESWTKIELGDHFYHNIGIMPDGTVVVHDYIKYSTISPNDSTWQTSYFNDWNSNWHIWGADAAAIQGIAFPDANSGFIGGMQEDSTPAQYYATTSGLENWEVKTFPGTAAGAQVSDFFFLNKNTGWASGLVFGEWDNNFLFTTTDGGKNWQKVSGTIPSLSALVFTNDKNGWAAATVGNYKLYKTSDAGKTWTGFVEVGADMWCDMRDICFVGNNFGIAVGGGGQIYRYGGL